jgi:4-carboxymuconolactone decarboxylase
MRLPLIPPADLTPEQKSLYDAMRKGIASNFNAFKVEREDGALMGPWNPWLHEPAIGKAIWDLTLAMTANATLSLVRASTPHTKSMLISLSPNGKG